MLNLIIREDNILKEWNYYLNANYIIYNEYENNELIDSFYYENKDLICNINDCNKDIDKLEYFYDELDKVLS